MANWAHELKPDIVLNVDGGTSSIQDSNSLHVEHVATGASTVRRSNLNAWGIVGFCLKFHSKQPNTITYNCSKSIDILHSRLVCQSKNNFTHHGLFTALNVEVMSDALDGHIDFMFDMVNKYDQADNANNR